MSHKKTVQNHSPQANGYKSVAAALWATPFLSAMLNKSSVFLCVLCGELNGSNREFGFPKKGNILCLKTY